MAMCTLLHDPSSTFAGLIVQGAPDCIAMAAAAQFRQPLHCMLMASLLAGADAVEEPLRRRGHGIPIVPTAQLPMEMALAISCH